jgi:hypothetical protein
MKKIASELLVERLIGWGVDTVFGLPGDGINGIMEGLRRHLAPYYGAVEHALPVSEPRSSVWPWRALPARRAAMVGQRPPQRRRSRHGRLPNRDDPPRHRHRTDERAQRLYVLRVLHRRLQERRQRLGQHQLPPQGDRGRRRDPPRLLRHPHRDREQPGHRRHLPLRRRGAVPAGRAGIGLLLRHRDPPPVVELRQPGQLLRSGGPSVHPSHSWRAASASPSSRQGSQVWLWWAPNRR